MQKLLLALLIFANAFAAEPTHHFLCNSKSGSDMPNEEAVDCNAVCLKDNGWSGNAIVSNTPKFKGITCLCGPVATRTSINEATYDYVPQKIYAVGGPAWIPSKCWRSGWSGSVRRNGKPSYTFTVNPGDEYCSTMNRPTKRKSGDACDKPKIEF